MPLQEKPKGHRRWTVTAILLCLCFVVGSVLFLAQMGHQYTDENLLYLKEHIPAGSTWSAFGVGAGHMPILYATLALGGHIRVGLEDNVIFGKDEQGNKIMATNQMLVKRAVQAVRTFGNRPATSAEARKILGIPPLKH